ncbi:MAG: ATP-binding protein [Vampirovibrionales bacterium]
MLFTVLNSSFTHGAHDTHRHKRLLPRLSKKPALVTFSAQAFSSQPQASAPPYAHVALPSQTYRPPVSSSVVSPVSASVMTPPQGQGMSSTQVSLGMPSSSLHVAQMPLITASPLAVPNANVLLKQPVVYSPQGHVLTAGQVTRAATYTEALQLLQQGKVCHADFYQQSNSLFTGKLPHVALTLATKEILRVTLTPETEQYLTDRMLQQGVPFEFQTVEQHWRDKVGRFALNMVQDSFLPLALIMGGIATAPLVMPALQRLSSGTQAIGVLREAIKPVRMQATVEKVLAPYAPEVQTSAHRFLNGRLPVLLLQGPPGTGKSHLMNSILAELGQRPGTLTLNGEVSPAVIDTVKQIYLSNPQNQEQVLKKLQQFTGNKPIQTLVLYLDEAEKRGIPADLSELIVKAIGNPKQSSGPTLPTLKMIATSNDLIPFDFATQSRIGMEGFAFVDHPSPRAMFVMTQEMFKQQYPQLPLTSEAQQILTKGLEENQGFSMRRLQAVWTDAQQAFQRQLKQQQLQPNSPEASKLAAETFTHTLATTAMDPAEMAGMIRREVVQRMTDLGQKHGFALSSDQRYDLQRTAWKKAEAESKTLLQDLQLRLDARSIRHMVAVSLGLPTHLGENHYVAFLNGKAALEPLQPEHVVTTIRDIASKMKHQPYRFQFPFEKRFSQSLRESLRQHIQANMLFQAETPEAEKLYSTLVKNLGDDAALTWSSHKHAALKETLQAFNVYRPQVEPVLEHLKREDLDLVLKALATSPVSSVPVASTLVTLKLPSRLPPEHRMFLQSLYQLMHTLLEHPSKP